MRPRPHLFGQGQGRATVLWVVVDDGRNTVVGGNLQERRFELLALGNVGGTELVIDPDLFEEEKRFVPPKVKTFVDFLVQRFGAGFDWDR